MLNIILCLEREQLLHIWCQRICIAETLITLNVSVRGEFLALLK